MKNNTNQELEKCKELFEYEMTEIKLNLLDKSTDAFDKATIHLEKKTSLEVLNLETPLTNNSIDLELSTPSIELNIPTFVEQAKEIKPEEVELQKVELTVPNNLYNGIQMGSIDMERLPEVKPCGFLDFICQKELMIAEPNDNLNICSNLKDYSFFNVSPLPIEQMQKKEINIQHIDLKKCENIVINKYNEKEIGVEGVMWNGPNFTKLRNVDFNCSSRIEKVDLSSLCDINIGCISENKKFTELKQFSKDYMKNEVSSLIKNTIIPELKNLSLEIPQFNNDESSMLDNYSSLTKLEEFAGTIKVPEIPKELEF